MSKSRNHSIEPAISESELPPPEAPEPEVEPAPEPEPESAPEPEVENESVTFDPALDPITDTARTLEEIDAEAAAARSHSEG